MHPCVSINQHANCMPQARTLPCSICTSAAAPGSMHSCCNPALTVPDRPHFLLYGTSVSDDWLIGALLSCWTVACHLTTISIRLWFPWCISACLPDLQKWLEEGKVEKYEISEEKYNQRQDTFRHVPNVHSVHHALLPNVLLAPALQPVWSSCLDACGNVCLCLIPVAVVDVDSKPTAGTTNAPF